jgi:hypothetical protein
MKYLKLFEDLEEDNSKYLIQLSSANSRGIWGMTNPPESIKKDAEEWWSLSVDVIVKLEIQSRYQNLPNDILTKLTGCRTDIERFGPSYLRAIGDLSEQDVKRFRYNGITDTKCTDAKNILSRVVKKFKRMDIEQKISYFDELESDEFLVIRNSYIYKVVDGKDLMDEVMSISGKLDIISQK